MGRIIAEKEMEVIKKAGPRCGPACIGTSMSTY